MTSDQERNLDAFHGVITAADRLADRGFAQRDPRGINNAGFQVLTDLLSVLIFQAGAGDTHAERVASATARAMLASVGDLYGVVAGDIEAASTETLELLADAVRIGHAS